MISACAAALPRVAELPLSTALECAFSSPWPTAARACLSRVGALAFSPIGLAGGGVYA
jgi:hypothetical protein